MIARALLFIAGLLAVAVTRKRAEHAPVAVLLLSTVLLDSVRDVCCDSAPRLDLALYLVVPALSAWCALLVLRGERMVMAIAGSGIGLFIGALRSPTGWAMAPLQAALLSCAAQAGAVIVWWCDASVSQSISATVCVVIMTGDLIGLLGPVGVGGPWWVSNAQTAAVAIAVALLQAVWLTREWARIRWASGVRAAVLLELLRALAHLHLWRVERHARARARSGRG